ncbi:MAG: hypothetical protein KDA60_06945, partial [Planctomycetales bacterium]|nr:hypothetical protein [Planctomycetales bacterium]
SFTCDDAAAIYVNGEEVHRYNLPQGELKATTQAELPAAGDMERFRMLFLVDASKLKPGKNVIAARVHQVLPSSSDLEFDLALTALTSDEEVAETAKKVEQSSNDLEKLTEEIQQALRARSQN